MEDVLMRYGLAGVVIFAEAIVIQFLYRENRKLWYRLLAAQEARRQEAIETTKELNRTMDTFSQNTQLLIDKIVEAKRRTS